MKKLVRLLLVFAMVSAGCTKNPTGPDGSTPPSQPTPTQTAIAFGAPSHAAHSAMFPLHIIVDGRYVGQISSSWSEGSMCNGGTGRLVVPATPGNHSWEAIGERVGTWSGTATATQGSCEVAAHLLCTGCETPTAGQFENWGVFRAFSGNQIQVCIRDHECEDGDRVSVFVNDQLIFGNTEIFNARQCRNVTARIGRNTVSLRADNGTGFKGNCDHSNGNTGEIIVTGADRSKTQSWRFRSGAGTVANMVVVN